MTKGVVMFIDLGYLRGAASYLHRTFRDESDRTVSASLDYWRIAKAAMGPHRCHDIRVYDATNLANPPAYPDRGWVHLEKHQGVTLHLSDTFDTTKNEQKEVDVNLATDLLETAFKGEANVIILLSGDQDFVPAVRKAKGYGCKVIVAQFSETQPGFHLARSADEIVNLDGVAAVQVKHWRAAPVEV